MRAPSASGRRRVVPGGRAAAALALLIAALAGSGCGGAIVAPEASSATSGDLRGSGVAAAGSEVCLAGRATGEGVECQAFRAADGRLYTLIGNLGDLRSRAGDDQVCVCGRPVEMSTCMQGTTITVSRFGPSDTCP